MSIEAMKQALEALECSRQSHYYCEDTWYSCPKHDDGCANEAEGDECNCGADETNKTIDAAIIALRAVIEQAGKQEPYIAVNKDRITIDPVTGNVSIGIPAAPHQWVGLTEEEIAGEFYKFEAAGAWYQFARAIEAKLKEKNT
jgi:hypothetical protein